MAHDILPASTKYNDLLGTAAADKADPADRKKFEDLFRKAGLDFQEYFPVVYTFGIAGEALWDGDPELSDIDFSMEALCVDRNTVGGSMQDVKKTVGPSGKLHVHRFWIYVELEEFFQLFKRFQVSFPNVGRANAGKAFSGCITKVVDDETFLQRDD